MRSLVQIGAFYSRLQPIYERLSPGKGRSHENLVGYKYATKPKKMYLFIPLETIRQLKANSVHDLMYKLAIDKDIDHIDFDRLAPIINHGVYKKTRSLLDDQLILTQDLDEDQMRELLTRIIKAVVQLKKYPILANHEALFGFTATKDEPLYITGNEAEQINRILDYKYSIDYSIPSLCGG